MTFYFQAGDTPKYCMTDNVKFTSLNLNKYELVMGVTSDNDGYDLLQYRTVPSTPRPPVHYERAGTVNTVPLCYMATILQKMIPK